MVRGKAFAVALVALLVPACTNGSTGAPAPRPSPAGVGAVAPPPAATAQAGSASNTALPPYAIDSLRSRPHTSGSVTVGALVGSGGGLAKYAVTWPSMGSTMTGVLDVPIGGGRHPTVIVNHGYVPASAYYVGQDSSKYADSLAATGFVTVSPDYPGYAGSGPPEADVPPIVAEAIGDMDLISAIPSIPQADPTRIAVAGHSNGGGVSLILLAADPRVRAVVLYAPVSSEMADNARKWWVHAPGGTGSVPNPDVDPAAYALMSPREHLPRTGPPTLIMQGTVDEQIPAAWTAATVDALKAAGIHTEFVSFPDAMHNFRGSDLVRANALAVDWLRTSLAA